MAKDLQRTFRARLSSSNARSCCLVVRRPAPSALVRNVLEFFWKILPLQAVDNFVRADVNTHIWPIVAVDRDRNLNLPTWKFFDEPLQFTDDGRPQNFQVAGEHNDLRISAIISMNRIIAIRLARKVVGPTKAFKQLFNLRIKPFEYFSLLTITNMLINANGLTLHRRLREVQ